MTKENLSDNYNNCGCDSNQEGGNIVCDKINDLFGFNSSNVKHDKRSSISDDATEIYDLLVNGHFEQAYHILNKKKIDLRKNKAGITLYNACRKGETMRSPNKYSQYMCHVLQVAAADNMKSYQEALRKVEKGRPSSGGKLNTQHGPIYVVSESVMSDSIGSVGHTENGTEGYLDSLVQSVGMKGGSNSLSLLSDMEQINGYNLLTGGGNQRNNQIFAQNGGNCPDEFSATSYNASLVNPHFSATSHNGRLSSVGAISATSYDGQFGGNFLLSETSGSNRDLNSNFSSTSNSGLSSESYNTEQLIMDVQNELGYSNQDGGNASEIFSLNTEQIIENIRRDLKNNAQSGGSKMKHREYNDDDFDNLSLVNTEQALQNIKNKLSGGGCGCGDPSPKRCRCRKPPYNPGSTSGCSTCGNSLTGGGCTSCGGQVPRCRCRKKRYPPATTGCSTHACSMTGGAKKGKSSAQTVGGKRKLASNATNTDLTSIVVSKADSIIQNAIQKISEIIDAEKKKKKSKIADEIKGLKYPEYLARAYKTYLWKKVVQEKPEIKSALDRAIEMEKLVSLEELEKISPKNLEKELGPEYFENIKKKDLERQQRKSRPKQSQGSESENKSEGGSFNLILSSDAYSSSV